MSELKPCPRCGTKAYLSRDVVDGFYFGWSAGCPRYCHYDGIHGTTIDTSEEDCYAVHGANSKEEAIEILEKDIHTEVPKAAISARKHDAAVRMALVALEKQIPVKPIILDQLNGDIDYECPMCGKQVMSDAESRNNYCGECGCKFDWSEIDETD